MLAVEFAVLEHVKVLTICFGQVFLTIYPGTSYVDVLEELSSLCIVPGRDFIITTLCDDSNGLFAAKDSLICVVAIWEELFLDVQSLEIIGEALRKVGELLGEHAIRIPESDYLSSVVVLLLDDSRALDDVFANTVLEQQSAIKAEVVEIHNAVGGEIFQQFLTAVLADECASISTIDVLAAKHELNFLVELFVVACLKVSIVITVLHFLLGLLLGDEFAVGMFGEFQGLNVLLVVHVMEYSCNINVNIIAVQWLESAHIEESHDKF